MPDQEVQKTLTSIVEELAQKYSGPVFEPHMTLLGDLPLSKEDVVSRTRKLASVLKPFPITLGKVECSTTYFQNVFVRVNTSALLLSAYIRARDLFDIDAHRFFMPHISLLYGDHSMQERTRIAETVHLSPLSFTANTLRIMTSGGDVSSWDTIEEIQF